MSHVYPEPGVRRFITASVMAATVMNALDTTIANVALPHIQGSVAASADEISWVLTSYIVAAAIGTPLAGWLAGRFGRKRLMALSIVGFTLASGLCGLSQTLGEIVGFRLLQGVFGAALIPMSQAILLDINPPEKHGSAMAIWSMGAVMGPIVGPTLGGWLTDNMTWRWVFYINLPIGVLALLGVWVFLSDARDTDQKGLDLFGFSTLALAIGSLQLMLDRGQTQDWFSSTEICLEAGSAAFFFYLFVAHSLTARRPFVDAALFADRNFVSGSVLALVMGVVLYGVLALLPPMLEGLLGYPVIFTGIVTAPRGIGSFVAMSIAGMLMRKVDPRFIVLTGLLLMSASMYRMAGFSLGMDYRPLVVTGFIQGLGTGFVFVPLSVVTFGTLDPKYRNEGAAMFALIRNIGSAGGISILQALSTRNGAIVHSRLIEAVRPDNPVMAWAAPGFDFTSPHAVAVLNAQVTAQAAMVAYTDDFWLLFLLGIVAVPLVFLIRKARPRPAGEAQLHMD